jgi:hypothetical protein
MEKLLDLKPEEFYNCGTQLLVLYKHDGVLISQHCILAKTFEDDFLFQVISIGGYYSGMIEGYIRKQFDENEKDKANLCTGVHLEEQLNKWVFQNIQSIKIVE